MAIWLINPPAYSLRLATGDVARPLRSGYGVEGEMVNDFTLFGGDRRGGNESNPTAEAVRAGEVFSSNQGDHKTLLTAVVVPWDGVVQAETVVVDTGRGAEGAPVVAVVDVPAQSPEELAAQAAIDRAAETGGKTAGYSSSGVAEAIPASESSGTTPTDAPEYATPPSVEDVNPQEGYYQPPEEPFVWGEKSPGSVGGAVGEEEYWNQG